MELLIDVRLGPVSETHITLGYVKTEAFNTGGHFSVEVLGQLRDAELQLEPLYDPDGKRMRN